MRKALLLLLWLLICVMPSASVRSQAEIRFSKVEVDLWPEFDRPSMLVIYKMTISPQIALPVAIRLRIPAVAGAPNAVAARQPGGALFNVPYDQELRGDWNVLSFNAATPEFQIEYYDPSLTNKDGQRHFEYFWPGDYASDNSTIQVQEPIGAKDLSISPSMGSGMPAGDGMVYYTQDLGALELGQTFSILIDYRKDDDSLSAANVPVVPSGPLDDRSSGWQSMKTVLPYFLALIGLALIIGGGLWYWRSGKRVGTSEQPVPRRRKASGTYADEVNASNHIYCHECGTRASPGDRFCRACGVKLRSG